ncbi:hypothetical protein L7F22_069366 [Adiantum nelumboides]|nr:hypothetical protein [Adiantum nelumboides]
MRLLEVVTGERDCKENSPSGVKLRTSKQYACSEYASTSSPITSSWIQRLIPAEVARVEQPQFLNPLPIGREGSDGLQMDWSYDTVYKSDNEKQSGCGLYENSRQVISSKHEALLTKTTICNEQVDVSPPGIGRISDLQVLQPKIQVPPRILPVVESLLNPGCAKHVMEAQLPMETNKLQNMLKSAGFSNPIKQTVHFSSYDRFRVSCSSIEGFNSRGARRVAGDFNASLLGDKCFITSQPTLEYSFSYPKAALKSQLDSTSSGIDAQTCTYPGMDRTNGPQTGETSGIRDSVSTMGLLSLERRHGSDESRHLDRGEIPYNIAPFSDSLMQTNLPSTKRLKDLLVDQDCILTMRNRNPELSQEHQDYGKSTVFDFEVSCGKGSAFSGGGCSNSGFGKGGTQLVSDFISSQGKASTREKTSLSLAPCVVEQDLGSSRDFQMEQDVTSGSFSFYSKGRLPYVSVDAKAALERGHWPFYESIEPLEVPKEQRTRDSVEALRLGMPLNNLSSMQRHLDYAYTTKRPCSPFFGTETLTEYGRHRPASKLDNIPQKPTGLDSNGVYAGESNIEAHYNHGVTHDPGIQQEKGRQLNDGIMSSNLKSNAARDRETYTCPSEAIDRVNWEGFKPSFKFGTTSVASIESCSKRPALVGIQDLGTTAEARNMVTVREGAIALPQVLPGEHSHSCSVGNGLHKALDGRKSGDDGAVPRKSMWLKRWSTMSPREDHALMKLQSNRETGIINSRHFVEHNHSSAQSSYESSHHFDLRPAKRACYGQRFGLHSEPSQAIPVLGFGSQNQQENGATSHFMKRFLTPSGAAMAVMGMTAQKIHATQPQRRGLLGVWPVASSESKALQALAKVGKEVSTTQKYKKEFSHFSTKPSLTQDA